DVSVVGYDDPFDSTDKRGIGDLVHALINTRGKITADGKTEVKAQSDTYVVSLSGSVAISKSTTTTSNVAIAGSATANTRRGDVKAHVRYVSLPTDELTIDASRTGIVIGLTAGVAVAGPAAKYSVGVAGSVSYQEITDTVEAHITGATVNLIG